MSANVLKTKLAEGKFFTVPGVHDMIAALMAERAGFDVVYGSGYWTTASAYGLPDTGIVSYTQMLDRMATIKRTIGSALIADADTGFGGLLNVHHTVKGYEQAGISAIQLEDQEFPKKCGHTPGKRVVATEEMVDKIKVAVEAREDMLIIARTDAYQSFGLDETLRRLEAYDKAGADILFPEAVTSDEEMRKVCETFGKPVLVNIANGGVTPPHNADVLAELGFAFAIYPSLTSLVSARAMELALNQLRDNGVGEPTDPGLFDFREFCSLVGFEEVWAFDKKWAR
ncbi:isocitrate lyase/PEP mutase family protein [Novosphingobium gossypii]|uniref:isocitrate lyase/PEP mutase family protein n=1 Tax=Novosphingobium gossypii TaxID=1604774 RepID=UPI003D219146